MTASQHSPETQQRVTKTKNEVPDEVAEIMVRSLQVGAGTGACGLLLGAIFGIIRSTHPVAYSLASGVHWFGRGSIYYGARTVAIARHGPEHQVTPSEKIQASAFGGAISGLTVSGLIGGPKSMLRGGLALSLLGAGGQYAVNRWTISRKTSETKGGSWLDSKWSPLKKLTDQEYESLLEEKLLRLDAEIALIDDNIAALRTKKEEQAKAAADKPPPTISTEGKL